MQTDLTPELSSRLDAAAELLRSADALLIGAGAGMGVDSGLPDFRGDEGFWRAYPPFRGRSFADLSNPQWFHDDPAQAWGFFGHRMNLYRECQPHEGFGILLRWRERFKKGVFVFTSNVDGHFQRAGFPEERVIECHGSIRFLQCVNFCRDAIWPADDVRIAVDPATIRATSELPKCPYCGRLARPNILMFYDGDWISLRTDEQRARFDTWLQQTSDCNRVALEFGAGLAVTTVRHVCERQARRLIRVNPREPNLGCEGVSLPMGALQAIKELDGRLRATRAGD